MVSLSPFRVTSSVQLPELCVTTIRNQVVSTQHFSGHGMDSTTILPNQADTCDLLWLTTFLVPSLLPFRCNFLRLTSLVPSPSRCYFRVAAFTIPVFRAHTMECGRNKLQYDSFAFIWFATSTCSKLSVATTAPSLDAKTRHARAPPTAATPSFQANSSHESPPCRSVSWTCLFHLNAYSTRNGGIVVAFKIVSLGSYVFLRGFVDMWWTSPFHKSSGTSLSCPRSHAKTESCSVPRYRFLAGREHVCSML